MHRVEEIAEVTTPVKTMSFPEFDNVIGNGILISAWVVARAGVIARLTTRGGGGVVAPVDIDC